MGTTTQTKQCRYGVMAINPEATRWITGRAHRVSWLLAHGTIPEGMNVLHICDNGVCVNPAHLYLGTQKDNVADMMNRGRFNPGHRHNGERHHKAKLHESQIKEIRQFAANGVTGTELSRRYGIAQSQIREIIRREAWKHVP
jgi:hypothetical protein